MSLKSSDRLKYHVLFFVTVCFAVALRASYYMGPSGADDIIYFSVVEKLLSNQDVGTALSSSKHWGVRLGVVFPVWAAMKLFGISEFSSYIFPLITSAGILVFVYIAGLRLFNPQVALLSSLIFALLPQDVYLSTVMYPDGPVVLFSALFIYLFYKLSGNENADVRLALITGIILGVAYFIRETALILLITIPILFFHAPNKKKFFRTAFFILSGLLLAIAFEMLVFWFLTGDPLTRWEILLGKTKVLEPRNFTVYSHSNVKSGSLLSRYLLDPFVAIFATHWISPLMVIIVAGVLFLQVTRKEQYKFFSMKQGHFLWLFILTFAILAFYSFGPVYGLTVPLKREVRYYHTITPLASLLAGVLVYEFVIQKGVKRFTGYALVFFYILASFVCLGSIINKNVHGLDLIEEFISQNPADNYIMPVMLKETLQLRRGSNFTQDKIVSYQYKKGLKSNDFFINELISNTRKDNAVQYVFIIPKIHEILIKFRRQINWPMEKMRLVKVMTTAPSISCRILKSSDMMFSLIPDTIKSKICYSTDVYVYQLK